MRPKSYKNRDKNYWGKRAFAIIVMRNNIIEDFRLKLIVIRLTLESY